MKTAPRSEIQKILSTKSLFACAGAMVAIVTVTLILVTRKGELDIIELNLRSEELSARQNALAALIEGWERHDASRADAAFISAVARDRDEKTRRIVFDLLETRPPLLAGTVPWLDEEQPRELRARHLALLARAKVRGASPHARAMLRSSDVETRKTALRYFIESPDVSAYSDIGRLIADRDCGALARQAIDRQYVNSLVALFNPAAIRLGGALGEMGEAIQKRNEDIEGVLKEGAPAEAADPTLAQLRARDAEVRLKAAIELGRAPNPKAAEPLFAALQDSDDGVSRAAAFALGECAAIAFRDRLIKLLAVHRAVVRRNAAYVLGRVGDVAAKKPLEDAFRTEQDEDAKGAILDALQALRGK